jgi:alginate O-acetyltransferase complex protein AlgF
MNVLKSTSSAMAAAFLALLTIAFPLAACAAAQDVASLYAPQPPADAIMLRVVNLSAQTTRLFLPGAQRPINLAAGAATRFSVVEPGELPQIVVDGQTFRNDEAEGSKGSSLQTGSAVRPGGTSITVALRRDARGWSAAWVSARRQPADGLKASLHVVNFIEDCKAKIMVDGKGPTVFPEVAAGVQLDRAINPVSARLVGSCGEASSRAWPLPALAAGDEYSLFMSGTRTAPILTGARDAVTWPVAGH